MLQRYACGPPISSGRKVTCCQKQWSRELRGRFLEKQASKANVQSIRLDFYTSENQDRRTHCSLLSVSPAHQGQDWTESAEYPSSVCCITTELDEHLQHQRTLHSPTVTPGATFPMQHVGQTLVHQQNVRDSVQAQKCMFSPPSNASLALDPDARAMRWPHCDSAIAHRPTLVYPHYKSSPAAFSAPGANKRRGPET